MVRTDEWPLPPRLPDYGALMADLGVPGLSAAGLVEGRLCLLTEGSVTPGGGPIGPNTVFQAGSVSKPVTALGAMRLVAQGKLDLDGDVNGYLRSWRVPAVGGWQARLTLRQLLSHTAGLTVHGFPGYRHDEPCPTITEVLDGRPPANTAPVRVHWLPGHHFKYSGGGFAVLQLVMTSVTGLPFADLMDQLVLFPAEMGRSTFSQPLPVPWHHDAAAGHNADGAVAGQWHTYPEMAAAGLWSTPSDLVRFAGTIVAGLRGDKGALLPRELAQMLVTPHARVSETTRMGLGVVVTGADGELSFGHSGADEGYLTFLRFAASGDAVAVMANAMSAGRLLHEVAADATSFSPGLGSVAPFVPAGYADLSGDYVAPDGNYIEVVRHGNGFALVAAGQDPLPLEHYAGSCWLAPLDIEVDLKIPAGPDETAVLQLRQLGETVVYVRRATKHR